jgi:hypothetical protein
MTVQPLEPAEFKPVGDAYEYTWPVTGIQVAFDRVGESRDGGLWAEATFARWTPGQEPRLLHDTRFNLLATATKAGLVKTLERQTADEAIDWTNLLETACFLVKRRFRDGEPAVDLGLMERRPRAQWTIRPYLAPDRPAVIFGPGGCGKTWFGLTLALAAACCRPIIGQPLGDPRRALVLDYEANGDVHQERLDAIYRGARLGKQLPPGLIFHQRMSAPLVAAAGGIRRRIAKDGIGLILIDSLAQAAGELEESGPIVQCFGAMRSFGVPVIVISHVTKMSMQNADEPGNTQRRLSPFGSVYTENSAGNCWSLRRRGDEGSDASSLMLTHEKTNNHRYQPRHAYRVTFTPGADEDAPPASVTYAREDFAAAFADRMPLTDQIEHALKPGPMPIADLVETFSDERPQNVRATVSNLKRSGRIIQLQDHRYALSASHDHAM